MRSICLCLLIASTLVLLTSGCRSFQRPGGGKSVRSMLGLRAPEDELSSDELLDPLGARNVDRLLWDDLTPRQIGTTLKIRATGGADQAKAQAHFDRGQELYSQGIELLESQAEDNQHQDVFSEAANEFRLASAYWRDSALEEDALYFEGESYFFADRYVQANRAFEKLIARFSGTRYLDFAEHRRFAIAIYWLQLSEDSSIALNDPKRPKIGMAKEARRVLHRIRIDDPTGKLADDATLTLAKAFMKAERYYEAADTLEDLRKNYPGSKHQFDAHMLELEARLASYEGPSYDDGPLQQADQLLKSIVKQFPREAEGNIDYLETQSKQIQSMLAQRDYELGEYFEGRGENLAARIHYGKVAERYNGTSVAAEINQRIAETEKKPDHPTQHAQWLVNIFPDPEKAKPVILTGNNEPIIKK